MSRARNLVREHRAGLAARFVPAFTTGRPAPLVVLLTRSRRHRPGEKWPARQPTARCDAVDRPLCISVRVMALGVSVPQLKAVAPEVCHA